MSLRINERRKWLETWNGCNAKTTIKQLSELLVSHDNEDLGMLVTLFGGKEKIFCVSYLSISIEAILLINNVLTSPPTCRTEANLTTI